MATITLQVEFSLFPDNTVLGPAFTLAGYRFTDIGGSPSFVNVSSPPSGPVKGLQFASPGVKVKIPVPNNSVTVRVAAFAGPFNIMAKNAAGATVATRAVPGDNAPHTYTLNGPAITRLDFIGGGNEGTIISISEKVTV